MNRNVSNKMVENYFRFMKYWDTDTKKNLIIKLTTSITPNKTEINDFSNCYGKWIDSRTSDEIIAEM